MSRVQTFDAAVDQLYKNLIDIKRAYCFIYIAIARGCSSVWLEYLPVTQGVAGSSPVNPAERDDFKVSESSLFVYRGDVFPHEK